MRIILRLAKSSDDLTKWAAGYGLEFIQSDASDKHEWATKIPNTNLVLVENQGGFSDRVKVAHDLLGRDQEILKRIIKDDNIEPQIDIGIDENDLGYAMTELLFPSDFLLLLGKLSIELCVSLYFIEGA